MRTLRPLDAAAVSAVLVMSLLSAVPLLARRENTTVVVKTADDEFRLPLDEDTVREISSNGHNLTLEIRDGEARVISADCPDHLCMRGKADRNGGTLICVPSRVMISVEGGADEIDASAG